ncbi:MAG: restriction endonuclease subunit S [Acholeplasmataceae bacterium]|nr:restriction endonuclease subunit S [Acholeplasmataceae bacterium]
MKIFDGTHNSPKYTRTNYHLVTSKFLINGSVDFNRAPTISEMDYIQINKKSRIDENDVLFSMIGTIGETAIVTKPHPYAIKNIGVFRTRSKASAKYLSIYLNSYLAKKHIHYLKNISVQSFLGLEDLRNFPVLRVDFQHQSNIVDIMKSKLVKIF